MCERDKEGVGERKTESGEPPLLAYCCHVSLCGIEVIHQTWGGPMSAPLFEAGST